MNTLRPLLAAGGLLALLAACDDSTRPRTPGGAEAVNDGQTATVGTPLPEPLVVRVLDDEGRPLRSTEVLWAAREGHGSIAPAASRTDGEGVARATWTLGTVIGESGRMEAVAVVRGLSAVSFTARPRPDSVAQLVLLHTTSDDTASVGVDRTLALSVRLADRYRNTVSGRQPAWSSLDDGVAVVSETGVVTGRGLGVAHIVARLDRGADTLPVRVSRTGGAAGWTALAAGEYLSCGVRTDGAAFCWGDNDFGQRGDGLAGDRAVPSRVAVPAGVSFRVVRAGLNPYACGIDAAGALFCWGQSTAVGGSTPARQTLPAGVSFADVSVEGSNLCGWTHAGEAYCRGFGGQGELGNGATAGSPAAFVRVAAPAGVAFRRLVHGRQAVCGLTTTGEVHCWGTNFRGQLGTGAAAGVFSSTPVRISAPAGVTFTDVGAGEQHFCAVAGDGRAFCWGGNDDGQVGNGASGSDVRTPAPVQAPVGVLFAAVAGGVGHSCAATTDGRVFCWGYNEDGELGNGSTAGSAVPVRALTPDGVRFDVVTAGQWHTCGLTLAGEAYCWGWNPDGALGNGRFDDGPTSAPVRVLDPAAAATAGMPRASASRSSPPRGQQRKEQRRQRHVAGGASR